MYRSRTNRARYVGAAVTVVAAVGSLSPANPAAGSSVGDAPYGGSITVGLEAESNTWTPGQARLSFPGHTIARAIYDPLVEYNGEGAWEPFLAESLEPNEDFSQWTLTLRDGVTFADGSPLDAETLKWNFDTLHFDPESLSYGVLVNSGLTGLEIVDDMTVRYDLAGPNAAFPDVLTIPAGWPVSRVAFEADPEGFGDHPVGTGPFVVQEWTRDDRLVVARNEHYWQTDDNGNQLPYLDEIVFRPIPDETSRVQSLSSGDVDMIQTRRGSSVNQLVDMADAGDAVAATHVGNYSDAVILNTLEPPLDDVRVRQALAHATDSEQARIVLDVERLADTSTGFFGTTSPWFSDAIAGAYPAYDVEAAQALLDEYRDDPERSDGQAAGSDVSIRYSCMPDPSQLEMSQLLQSLWQEAGFSVELEQVDNATNIAAVVGTTDTDPPFRGTFSAACWQMGGGADPMITFQTFFGPVDRTPTNFANLTDPAVDEQVTILRTSADHDERYAAVEAIGRFSAEQVPIVWLSSMVTAVGYDPSIAGVEDWTMPSGSDGLAVELAIPRFYHAHRTE